MQLVATISTDGQIIASSSLRKKQPYFQIFPYYFANIFQFHLMFSPLQIAKNENTYIIGFHQHKARH